MLGYECVSIEMLVGIKKCKYLRVRRRLEDQRMEVKKKEDKGRKEESWMKKKKLRDCEICVKGTEKGK